MPPTLFAGGNMSSSKARRPSLPPSRPARCSTASKLRGTLAGPTKTRAAILTWWGCANRALIGVMVYTFARINVVLKMKVGDYFVQGRHGWVRLHEKGRKDHGLPVRHNLEPYLEDYI